MARNTSPEYGQGKGKGGYAFAQKGRKTARKTTRRVQTADKKPQTALKALPQKRVAGRGPSVFARAPLKFKTRNQYEDDLILNNNVKKLRDDLKKMGVYGYSKGQKSDVVKILGGIKFFDRKMPSRSRSPTEQKEYIERYNKKAKRRKVGKPKGRTACENYKIYKDHVKVGGKKIKCKPLRDPPTRDENTKRCRFCQKQSPAKSKSLGR